MTGLPHIAVIGGGIGGLSAAHALCAKDAQVTVFEASSRLGGKLQTETFFGQSVDVGPDAFLARRPEAVDLCQSLGVEVAPIAASGASVLARGKLQEDVLELKSLPHWSIQ
jgi:protoporphyrinogen/coproporphyrinogen III oxidase